MARERYTVQQWFEEIGSKHPYEFTSISYVRSCCREQIDPRNNRPCKLPPGWKAKKDHETQRWFIYPDIATAEQKSNRAEIAEVRDSYKTVKLDPDLQAELENQLRQAILHGIPKRIAIEFLPEPVPRATFGKGISTNKLTQWFSKQVGRIFNEHGHEISLGLKLKSNDYDYHPLTDMEFLLRAWWRLNVEQGNEASIDKKKSTSKQKEFLELEKLSKEYLVHNPDRKTEVMNQLWKRCIWCGNENRKINPIIRVHAKYCSVEHRSQFQSWLDKLKNSSVKNREAEFRTRLEKIRLALAT